jgi:hypothetical protein
MRLLLVILPMLLGGCMPVPPSHDAKVAFWGDTAPYDAAQKGIHAPFRGIYKIVPRGNVHILILPGYKKVASGYATSGVWRQFVLEPDVRPQSGPFELRGYNAKRDARGLSSYGTLLLLTDDLEPIEVIELEPGLHLETKDWIH